MRQEPVDTVMSALRDPVAAAGLLAPAFAGLTHEELWVLHLDQGFVPLHASVIGGCDSVVLPIARIAREALALDAGAVLIAHNHPGGDPRPSRDDRLATVRLADALRPLSILLVDHLIFAGDAWVSFHRLGLL